MPLTISCWCLWLFCRSAIWQSLSTLCPLAKLLPSPGCPGLCGRAAPLAGAPGPRGDTGRNLSPMLLVAEPFSQTQKLGKHIDPGGFFPTGVLSAEGVSFHQSSTAQGFSELTHPSTATHRYLPHSEIPESGPRWVTCPQIELSRMLQLPSASA